MCRANSPTQKGRRCNKHNAYGKQLTNLQARKQYYARKHALHPTAELQQKIETLQKEVDTLKQQKNNLGHGLTPYTMTLPVSCEQILIALEQAGYKPYIVGGSVRDSLLNLNNKDYDIEVYGATADEIINTIKPLGRVDEVGKSFGVIKIRIGEDEYDLSLPRLDNKTGSKHTDFDITLNPNLTLEEASSRRDYTLNALMYSHSLGYIIDKHGGLQDLRNKQLRHIGPAYTEDPLRVLRGVQMASRFGFTLHPDTVNLARTLKEEYSTIPVERVQVEFQKLYEKGKTAHKAIQLLYDTEWAEKITGLATANKKQLIRNARQLQQALQNAKTPQKDKPKLIAAAILKTIQPEHREQFLHETTIGNKAAHAALTLASQTPPKKHNKATIRHWATTFKNDTTIEDWVTLEKATGDKQLAERIQKQAQKYGVYEGPEKDWLTGNDILALHPDRKAGPWVKDTLQQVRNAQYDRQFHNKEQALEWAKKHAQTGK